MGARIEVQSTAALIGYGRVAVAALMVYLSISDPDEFGFLLQWDDIASAAYLAMSVPLLVMAVYFWWWDFVLARLGMALDLAAFILIPQSIEPMFSGFFAAATASAVMIILNVAIRFGPRSATVWAIVLNLICYAICLAPHFGLTGRAMGMDDIGVWLDLRHLLFLTMSTAAVVWFIRSSSFQPRVAWPELATPATAAELLEEQLEIVLGMIGAASGLICWKAEGGSCNALMIGREASGIIAAPPPCGVTANPEDRRNLVFDLRHGRALELHENGTIKRYRGDIGGDDFLARLPRGEGISIAFYGLSGSGRIALTGIPLLHCDYLRLAPPLAAKIAQSFDRFEVSRLGRTAELAGLRGSIARDLHDSVAQSLAGAIFWLRGLIMNPALGDAARSDIAQAAAALEGESATIRQVIERLRSEAVLGEPSDLVADLRREVEGQCGKWRLTSEFSSADRQIVAGAPVVYEVQQIMREALANAARHGKASHVSVTLSREPGILKLVIADDGSGFARLAEDGTPRSLAERSRILGGRVTVRNNAGRNTGEGAIVDVFLPGVLFR